MNRKGFTLIELAVVLLVISILAAVVLRNIGTQGIQARDAKRVGDMRNVSVYLAQYLAKTGSFPTSTVWSGQANSLEDVLKNYQVISTPLPHDPSQAGGNADYEYWVCSDTGNAPNGANPGIANHYVLRAVMEQSQANNPRLYDGVSIPPASWKCRDGGAQSMPGCSTANREYCVVN